jgi:hypothetical protein
MLNGIDPVIIFQFSKLAPASVTEALSRIPVLSSIPTFVEQPPIPVYLSENLTGLFIDTEDKSIDIQTDTETKSDGSAADIKQKGISNVETIVIQGKKNSVGLMLLSALADVVFEKLTSQEYSISYLHGAVTIFRGQLSDFKISQNANTDLVQITVGLTKGSKNPQKPSTVVEVPKSTGPLPNVN